MGELVENSFSNAGLCRFLNRGIGDVNIAIIHLDCRESQAVSDGIFGTVVF